MTTKPLLLLAALTLCYCIASVHALPKGRCMCIRVNPTPVPERVIRKIEVFPISGSCRRPEVIVTRRKGSKVCVDPNAAWVNKMLSNLKNLNSGSSTASPTASEIQF